MKKILLVLLALVLLSVYPVSALLYEEVYDAAGTRVDSMEVFGSYIYAGTYNDGKIFRSSTGASGSWSEVYDTSESYVYAMEVHGSYLYAGTGGATGTTGKIYRTSDGTTWNLVNTTNVAGVTALGVDHDDTYIYAGLHTAGSAGDAVWRSSDGSTWTVKTTSLTGDSGAYVYCLHPFGTDMYAGSGAVGEIFYSSDDGGSWNLAEDTTETNVKDLEVFDGDLYAATTPYGRVYSSANGLDWSTVYDSANDGNMYALDTMNSYLYVAGGDANAYLMRTLDGATWGTAQATATSALISLAVFNNNLYIGTSNEGKIYRGNWSPTADFNGNITTGTAPLTIQFHGGLDTTYAALSSSKTYYWDFGDTETDAVSSDPLHEYHNPGTYTVSFTAGDLDGTDTETKVDYITVTEAPPVAAFSANVTSGYLPLYILFTDSSTNTPTSWDWSFGDTESSATQSPVHVYDTWIGTSITQYTVALEATNDGGSDTETKTNYITAYPLNASFTVNVTSGNIPLYVGFTDATNNGTATAWDWDWGDGTAHGNTQNPVHPYTVAGTYTVTLNASNSYSYDIETWVDLITASSPGAAPVAAFSANTTTVYPSGNISFTDNSANTPTGWYWDFGDGHTDTVQNPIHTYDDVIGGAITTYTVKLNASNAGGEDWENKTAYISAYPLLAGFAANVTSGNIPLDVAFTNSITHGTPTTYDWDWGDGTAHGTTANPTHQYTVAGTYTVTLNASNAYSYGIESKVDYITASAPGATVAAFGANVTSGRPAFTVQFTDTSTNSPTSWYWDFGDGDTNTTQNPIHTYDSVIGNTETYYTVCLNATGAGGSDWENKTAYITSTPLVAAFAANHTSGTFPFYVGFTDATDSATAWSWVYGDGSALGNTQNPSHTYTYAGTFTVVLNASDAYSWDLETKTDYIYVADPSSTDILTFAATGVTVEEAVLNGFLNTGDTECWFEYGFAADALGLMTETQTVALGSDFSFVLEHVLTDKTYYYRAAHANGTGTVETFTIPADSAVTIPTYGESYFDPMMDAKFNLTEMVGVGSGVFGDALGGGAAGTQLFYGFLWCLVLGVMFIRQESSGIMFALVLIAGAAVGLQLFSVLPPQLTAITGAGAALVIGGIGYIWWRKR